MGAGSTVVGSGVAGGAIVGASAIGASRSSSDTGKNPSEHSAERIELLQVDKIAHPEQIIVV